MSVNADHLGKLVAMRYGTGSLKSVGVMVGYCYSPTAIIQAEDGSQTHWVADLCEEIPMREDIAREIKKPYETKL